MKKWFRDYLTVSSRLKFYLWRLRGSHYFLKVCLKDGVVVHLRLLPYNDVPIAHEIFAERVYDPPKGFEAAFVRIIVDVGSNVGFSCAYWTSQYPGARIIAFEPHPKHTQQIEKHLKDNKAADRTRLIPKAAGVQNEHLHLTDDQYCSTLVKQPTGQTIAVDVVDFYKELGKQEIDLLKIDIEGAEYDLINDPRFLTLKVGLCVIEWHITPEHPNGNEELTRRLEEAKYQVKAIPITDKVGILWAKSLIALQEAP